MLGRSRFAVSSANFRKISSLTLDNLNPRIIEAQYAVRGELLMRAEELTKQIARGAKLPFKKTVSCNIGNPQALGQQPITFFREVLALCQAPFLLSNPDARKVFSSDALERAKKYLDAIGGGCGAYSGSTGVHIVRKEVAEYIKERDGFASDPDLIFLTDGASPGIKTLLSMLIRGEQDGILTPIPQYPLYSATITLLGGSRVGYYLDESNRWGLSLAELQRAAGEAKAKGIDLRGLVVINPGNPTGQCLPKECMEKVVKFAKEENLVLLSDEVYQTNIYGDIPFHSFKQTVESMGPEYSDVELASFHSTSKGYLGECGQRGGYVEMRGFRREVLGQMLKIASISLCSNLSGQIMTGLMANPPRPGDPSYERFARERDNILASLKRRATLVARKCNELKGYSCNEVDGALYAFPKVALPAKAIEAAKAAGKSPDTFYCLKLLEATGLCVVPGSGFDQVPGTYHFRIAILPPENEMEQVLELLSKFHAKFMAEYGAESFLINSNSSRSNGSLLWNATGIEIKRSNH
eukprot:g33965.t1